MTSQPIDKIILNESGAIIGYQLDNSGYLQKYDKPVWGKPDNSFNNLLFTYNSNILTRQNTNITPGLVYKKLCNNLGSCLSTYGNDPDDIYAGSPIIQNSINSTNLKWAFDGENLCNNNGYCIYSTSNYNGAQLIQMEKQNSQKYSFNSGNICNKINNKCLASRENRFVENGDIIQWDRTNENGQLWNFI